MIPAHKTKYDQILYYEFKNSMHHT